MCSLLHLKCRHHLILLFLLFHLIISVCAKHCPVLNQKLSDFGIEDCPPSLSVTSVEEFEASLKRQKCVGFGEWTIPASFGCSSPVVPEGTALKFPCECDFGGECKVYCLPGYELQGEETIICEDDGVWSTFPKCKLQKCEMPALPSLVVFDGTCNLLEGTRCKLKCISDDYHIEGESEILCQNQNWITAFPECRRICHLSNIPSYLVPAPTCHGSYKETCPVHCKNELHSLSGEHHVKCLESGSWGEIPTCGCSSKKIPPNIIVERACTYEAGKSCSAKCSTFYYKGGGDDVLVCDMNGSWDESKSIKCHKICPEPDIPEGLQIIGSCNAKFGEKCNVKCKTDMRLVGDSTFKCLPSGSYSPIPGCAVIDRCPYTNFPTRVKFIGRCGYTYGETCFVGCEDDYDLIGPPKITCTTSGTWSYIPKCVGVFVEFSWLCFCAISRWCIAKYCPELQLLPNQLLKEGTTCNKRVGDSCSVECEKNYSPTVAQVVKCLQSSQWETLNPCKKMCSHPTFPRKVISLRHCSRTIGSVCELSCQENRLVITPTNKIVCRSDATWSPIPECKKQCDKNQLSPEFKFLSCPEKMLEGDSCELGCVNEKKHLLGDKNAKCTDARISVDENLRCAGNCGRFPLEKIGKVNEPKLQCDNLEPYDECVIPCYGIDIVVTCLGDDEFSEFNKCEKKCETPLIPENTAIIGYCDNNDGTKCELKCYQKHFNTEQKKYFYPSITIECVNGAWRNIPELCVKVCVLPEVDSSVRIVLPCHWRINSVCGLRCASTDHKMFGSDYIKCTEEETWTNLDTYCAKTCSPPHLPEGMKIREEQRCTFKASEACGIRCEEPFVLVGRPSIRCEVDGRWARFPKCVKRCPAVDLPLKLVQPCDRNSGKSCAVSCPPDFELVPNIDKVMCKENGEWEQLPECQSRNLRCMLPPYLKLYDPTCDISRRMCRMQCTDMNEFIRGEEYVKCDEYKLSALPDCISLDSECGELEIPYEIQLLSCHRPFKVFKKCKIKCQYSFVLVDDIDFIFCDIYLKWSNWPNCVRRCGLPLFGSEINPIMDACPMIADTYCAVQCTGKNVKLYEITNAYCNSDGNWINIPQCYPDYETRCTYSYDLMAYGVQVHRIISPNEFYVLKCGDTENFRLNGPRSIVCIGINIFSSGPTCVPVQKKYPDCPRRPVNLPFDCPNVKFGDQCIVQSQNCKVNILKTFHCLGSEWSKPVPSCELI